MTEFERIAIRGAPPWPRLGEISVGDELRSEEVKMTSSGDCNKQAKNYQAGPVVFRIICSHYSSEEAGHEDLAGSVRPPRRYVCAAVELNSIPSPSERSSKDVRLDIKGDYQALIQLSGRSTMIQKGQITDLAVGDIALIDAARCSTQFSHDRPSRWVTLHLPRQAVLSHLGLKPACGSRRGSESIAGRVLFHLIQDAVDECEPSSVAAAPHMQLAIYELLGALFATPDLPTLSSHTDKLFKRISRIINNRFADATLGPSEVAAEAGISLRYLQKLFKLRGSSCTQFLQSVRLEYAARQLHRRRLLGPRRPISEIAYASGFSDYTHFARQFRRRFGHTPVAHVPDYPHPWRLQGSGANASAGHVYLAASSNLMETSADGTQRLFSAQALHRTRSIREDAA
jgi:AraC-like DNA-binding protein